MLLICSFTMDPGLYTTDKQAHVILKNNCLQFAKENLKLVNPFCWGRRHSDLSYASPMAGVHPWQLTKLKVFLNITSDKLKTNSGGVRIRVIIM
jgi:hypothetical protein